VKVEWTDHALEQLWAIHEYLSSSSPDYAQRVVDRLTNCTRQISNFPLSGRKVPEYGVPQIREVMEGPYRIIYLHQDRPDRHLDGYSRSQPDSIE